MNIPIDAILQIQAIAEQQNIPQIREIADKAINAINSDSATPTNAPAELRYFVGTRLEESAPSETPETDIHLKSQVENTSVYMVGPDFARNLERQRNEARAQRDALADALRNLKNASLKHKMDEDDLEIDDANEALATLNPTP